MSYKTADSRRFIERTFLDKVEHIHQKLFNRFYIFIFFLIGLESPSHTFQSCFPLFWHDDGYHRKEKSLEDDDDDDGDDDLLWWVAVQVLLLRRILTPFRVPLFTCGRSCALAPRAA